MLLYDNGKERNMNNNVDLKFWDPLSLNAKSIWCQTSFIWSFKQGNGIL